MILRQTFSEPIGGYWDGGKKSRFDWTINGPVQTDTKGDYVKVGSWEANHWFHVSLGKTTKQTLTNARRRLMSLARKAGKKCSFEYIEESK